MSPREKGRKGEKKVEKMVFHMVKLNMLKILRWRSCSKKTGCSRHAYNLQPGGLREEDHRFRASLAYIERPCIKQNIEEASVGVGLPFSVRGLPSLCEALESVP